MKSTKMGNHWLKDIIPLLQSFKAHAFDSSAKQLEFLNTATSIVSHYLSASLVQDASSMLPLFSETPRMLTDSPTLCRSSLLYSRVESPSHLSVCHSGVFSVDGGWMLHIRQLLWSHQIRMRPHQQLPPSRYQRPESGASPSFQRGSI